MRRSLVARTVAIAALGVLATIVPLASSRAQTAPLPQLPPAGSSAPPETSDFGVPDDTAQPPPLPPPSTPPTATQVPETLPPPAPSADEPTPAERAAMEESRLGKTMRPSFKGAAGLEYGQIRGVPITGGRFRAGVGGQNDKSAHYVVVSVLYGSTTNGLRTWDLRLGWNGDLYRDGILRLGVDVELGYLTIHRATFDDRLWAAGVGGAGHASIDLVPFGPRGDHALTVEGRLEAHLHFGGAFFWGPSILLGFRY